MNESNFIRYEIKLNMIYLTDYQLKMYCIPLI